MATVAAGLWPVYEPSALEAGVVKCLMGTSAVILFLLAAASWLGMLVTLPSFVGAEVHGDAVVGVGIGFFTSLVFAGLTWLWVAGLLLIAGTRDLLPGWENLAALVLGPLSAAAVGAAYFLLSDPHTRWPVVIPVVAPVLLGGYAFALMVPWRALSTPGAGRTLWLMVLVVALAPWPALVTQIRDKARERAAGAIAMAEWKATERERKHAENREKLKAMPAGAPLTNWYPLLEADSGVRAEAMEALRHDPGRQAQIEEMLGYDIPIAMFLLPDLDLEATPALCQAAGTYLLKSAKGSHLRKRDDPRPYTAEVSLHESLPGIRWLTAHGCNCDEGIAALEASARTYLDSPDRQKLLGELEALGQH
jgi:hypothetical protein